PGDTWADVPTPLYKLMLPTRHSPAGPPFSRVLLLRRAGRPPAAPPPPVPGTPTWQARAASLTHGLLYALLFAMPVSGWVVNAASGFPLHWFGLFRVPQFGGRDDALHALAKGWHEWLFWALVVLALAHAFAAVWHHLFRGDATLARMLPRGWLEEDPQ